MHSRHDRPIRPASLCYEQTTLVLGLVAAQLSTVAADDQWVLSQNARIVFFWRRREWDFTKKVKKK